MNKNTTATNEFNIPAYLDAAVKTVSDSLRKTGLENSRLDARLIVSHAAGVPVETCLIQPELELDALVRDRVAGLMMRRMMHEPISHILGEREFWSLMFEVTPDTLVPRPDTETLVEFVLKTIRNEQRQKILSILDIGTGSGCVLLAILSELHDAKGVGVDINPEALNVARRNAARHGLDDRTDFLLSDCFDSVDGIYDVIVSNPPYIKTNEIAKLDPEVAEHEPFIALDGGLDGLCFYREISEKASAFLKPGGILSMEVGIDQSSDVVGILERSGYSCVQKFQDLAGRDRVVMATRR